MKLEKIREKQGLSQSELDALAGLRKGTVHDIERKRNERPSWETVARLSAALKVRPEELFPIETNDAA